MHPNPTSDWPAFESPELQALRDACNRRRKGLRYRLDGAAVARSLDTDADAVLEVLTFEGKSAKTAIQMMVWSDFQLWFQACRPSRQGWEYLIEFRGDLTGVPADRMPELLKATPAALLNHAGRAESLLACWAEARPVLEKNEGHLP